MRKKVCECCGNKFGINSTGFPSLDVKRFKLQKYCSLKCRKLSYKKPYSKEYYLKHRDKRIKTALNYYYKNREKVLSYQIDRIENLRKIDDDFRKKYNLRHNSCQTHNLSSESCEICYSTVDLQRHHSDYNDSKKVTILCRECHTKLHNTLKMVQPQLISPKMP